LCHSEKPIYQKYPPDEFRQRVKKGTIVSDADTTFFRLFCCLFKQTTQQTIKSSKALFFFFNSRPFFPLYPLLFSLFHVASCAFNNDDDDDDDSKSFKGKLIE